jgi:tetratricopeptide (TPR) repeat protein/KaiC/GvpD/RAD55 family RecA-like ATPase
MGNVLWNWVGDKEKGKEHHDAALEILEVVPESVELARVYNDSGHRLRRMGNLAEALSLEKKALGIAERLDAQDVIAETLQELALEFLDLGDFKKAQDYAGRALKIALDNNYLETTLWAYDRVGGFTYGEEYEKRFECFEKGLALAKKIGNAAIQCDFLLRQASEYLHRGEFNKTMALGEEALSLAKKIKGTFFVSWALCDLGEAYTHLGEWDKSERHINEALNAAREIKEYPSIAGCYFLFGLLYLCKGEYAKARESFEEACRLQGNAGCKLDQMYTSWFLVPPSIELGEVSRAQDLLDSWHKFALETKDRATIIWEKELRAMLLRAQKKYAESIKLFEEALQESESLKANIFDAYWFARQLLSEYARVYLERDQSGDREKALNLLNRALAMFDKMGAKPDIEKVEARIAFIETGKEVLKPRLPELVSTGYVDLDKLLCGGLPSSCAVVLTSPSCNERDLLIKSFLETGAKKDEAAFYVTINPGSVKTLADEYPSSFWLFVCNPQAGTIVKDAPNIVKLKGVENLTEISIALTSAIRKLDPSLKGARRICLGLVSDVLLQHHAVQTRRWIAGLIPELQSQGFTTLALIEPQVHPSEELHAILGLFDGEISLYEKETDKGPGKYLRVKKMGNSKYLEDELPLRKEQR